MATRQAIEEAKQSGSADDAISLLIQRGVWMADEDTMTQAVHDVYCGIMADHQHPSDKDRDQARQLIAAIGRSIGSGPAA
jgi:hypothetical protein